MIRNVLFLFGVLAAVFVVYLPSYLQMQGLRERNESFEKRINELEADNARMGEERDRLVNDPEYFEKVARERMGLIKEGEVIYKVLPPGVKKTEEVEEKKPEVPKPAAKSAKKKKPKSSSAKKKTNKDK